VKCETTDEAEHSAILNLVRDGLQTDDVLVPALWCLGRVVMLITAAPEQRLFFFLAAQLAGILRSQDCTIKLPSGKRSRPLYGLLGARRG
jgi:hypothetical protein